MAPIAPHEDGRQSAKSLISHAGGAGGNVFLIHISTPLEHCEKTDRHGVYAAARKGDIQGFIGVDDKYEVPKKADLVVDTTQQTVPEAVHGIVLLLETQGLI
jgi:sulfate adenylyltransferase